MKEVIIGQYWSARQIWSDHPASICQQTILFTLSTISLTRSLFISSVISSPLHIWQTAVIFTYCNSRVRICTSSTLVLLFFSSVSVSVVVHLQFMYFSKILNKKYKVASCMQCISSSWWCISWTWL